MRKALPIGMLILYFVASSGIAFANDGLKAKANTTGSGVKVDAKIHE